MKVKKYIALNMQDAMKKIRSELGNDAVILNSKVIHTGGFLGLFTKKKIEVIAAMDPDVPSRLPIQKQESTRDKRFPIQNVEVQNVGHSNQSINQPMLISELKELKGLIQSISVRDQQNFYPEPIKKIHEHLIQQGVSSSVRGIVLAELLERWYSSNGNLAYEEVEKDLKEILIKQVQQLAFTGISYKKKFINVIGPTGVGKTTTLAKLAAECMLQQKKSVAFITTDTYRIAAIDQLKTYAKIFDAPIEVCYNIEDYKEAKQKLQHFDYVFIDTAGRNFRNLQYVKDLQSIIDFDQEMETFLVLAATSKLEDMLAVYEQFSIIHVDKLIITKLDETASKGALFDLMVNTNTGIAYTTHGQNVPDDIQLATRERIIDEILR